MSFRMHFRSRRCRALVLIAGGLLMIGCSGPRPSQSVSPAAPAEPKEAEPLGVGAMVPEVNVKAMDGTPVSLAGLCRGESTVLIFYRGGWCPFCNRHLADVATVEPKLRELGYQILAVSADRPEELRETAGKLKLDYTLLSDNDMTAAKAFGLAFTVDPALVEKYKTQYKIDLEAASGRTHHMLPVPALYLVDRTGRIEYAHSDPNYKVRVSGKDLLAEATKFAGK